jgi:hypothetical protein
MGLPRFAILYPDTAYGRTLMNLFWNKAELEGGSITAIESYKPEETDFAVEIKKMVGLHYPRPESVVQALLEKKYRLYQTGTSASDADIQGLHRDHGQDGFQ